MISFWRRWPQWWRKSIIVSLITVGISLALLWRCTHPQPDFRDRVDHPMSLAEAKRHEFLADFPFPASAHDIYVAAYADWISIETLIRFDAPEADCKASVPKILEWSQKDEAKTQDYAVTALTEEVALPAPSDTEWLPDVKWWTGLTVRHGYFAGEEHWDFRQLWIDSDLGRVYFYQVQ